MSQLCGHNRFVNLSSSGYAVVLCLRHPHSHSKCPRICTLREKYVDRLIQNNGDIAQGIVGQIGRNYECRGLLDVVL